MCCRGGSRASGAEGHAGDIGAAEAAVGDGDAMGVAAEIGEHPFGRPERRLGITTRRFFRGGRSPGQVIGVATGSRAPKKRRPPAACATQALEEQAAEQPGGHSDRQEETAAATGDPAAVGGQYAAGDEAVEMRVMG